MTSLRLGLVGIGKIARDQHIPAIAAQDGLELAAACSRNAAVEGVPTFKTLGEMLSEVPDLDAVSLCMPPAARHAYAREALEAGKHVILEKPPGATLAEIEPLRRLADEKGLTLFATWHSRFADAVAPARDFLKDAEIASVRMIWKEDVRHWHPGQEWIWEPGGLGVFDPGINGFSIATAILPRPIFLTQSTLSFPANRATPIAAELTFSDERGLDMTASLDWLQTGEQSWDIVVETNKGRLVVAKGGAVMSVDGKPVVEGRDREYPGIYAHFLDLVREKRSDVDLAPLTLVADAYMFGRRVEVEPFH